MATSTELQKTIDELDTAIKNVALGGQSTTIDILGYRRTITRANLKDMMMTRDYYMNEHRRTKRKEDDQESAVQFL